VPVLSLVRGYELHQRYLGPYSKNSNSQTHAIRYVQRNLLWTHWSMRDDLMSRLSCPILTGATNYPMWKIRIFAKLHRKKVLAYATGRTPQPTTTTPTLQIYTSVTSTMTWEEGNEKAHGLIIEHISNCTVTDKTVHMFQTFYENGSLRHIV
jgi:hypothetical protein